MKLFLKLWFGLMALIIAITLVGYGIAMVMIKIPFKLGYPITLILMCASLAFFVWARIRD